MRFFRWSSLRRRGRFRWTVFAVLLSLSALCLVGVLLGSRRSHPQSLPEQPSEPLVDVSDQVHQFCAACHAYPPPESFPRKHWDFEVRRGYSFAEESPLTIPSPPIEAAIKYFQDRAPLELPPADIRYAPKGPPIRFEPTSWPGPFKSPMYAISNVNLVHLFDRRRLDILACDMNSGAIMALRPYERSPKWQVLANATHPAHAEVVDLDGDGIQDILVADLGNLQPTDLPCGSVLWLRGNKDGGFTPHTLLKNVGRVADVQAADFRGSGKRDLVVAEFGWNKIGSILVLENHTTDWSQPKFVPRTIDTRHGAIHVPILDLNGDGKPDFIGLISQEHETIVAYLNEGGSFRKETIYTAPHPAYGSSGVELVDMNGDGHIDVLYTNGDTLDLPALLKPYHGIHWLENPGDGTFPWKHHPIAPMYGVNRAIAADVDGDGDMDVVAVSFLSKYNFPVRKEKKLDAIVLLEQTAPGAFARHSLKTVTCDHVTCMFGDIMGTGRPDLVVGNFGFNVERPVVVWRHMGKSH